MSLTFDPRPIASRFWERAGATEPFPRRLSPTIAAVLPVAVVLLPKLTVGRMGEWLAKRGAGGFRQTQDRPIRGCLIAQRGHAFIFADGSMPDDEQRLTLAHETAHFLHHYEAPRSVAIALLGPSIEEVLDGDRTATPAEKLRGALRGVPIGVYEHALDRSEDGAPDTITTGMEVEADLIGFELLAPAATVKRSVPAGEDCVRALSTRFGLPGWAAKRWSAWIDARRTRDPLIARLESARKKSVESVSKSDDPTGSTEQAAEGQQKA
ncbi:MAG TPA: ImmA/IrrE family metallo-endopeptidase [Polyangia bacterium]|nr:ImmA/IrrE family metallo-endopeptidase [Polyangia bacterium]